MFSGYVTWPRRGLPTFHWQRKGHKIFLELRSFLLELQSLLCFVGLSLYEPKFVLRKLTERNQGYRATGYIR